MNVSLAPSYLGYVGEDSVEVRRRFDARPLANVLVNDSTEVRPTAEVEQESYLEVARLEIVSQLGFVERVDLRSDLTLDEHAWLNHKVGLEGHDWSAPKKHGERHFLPDGQTGIRERNRHPATHDEFRKAGQLVIDVVKRADGRARDIAEGVVTVRWVPW